MYIIRKQFEFSAGHKLCGLPEGHPCGTIHGHNYVVTVELRSKTLNKVGFVKDYRELGIIKDAINESFDHQFLNDVLAYNPTAENMACDFYLFFKGLVPEVYAVEVSETPKTMARYEE